MKNIKFYSFLTLLISSSGFSAAPNKGSYPVKLNAEVINTTTVKLTWEGGKKDYAYRVRSREAGRLDWAAYYTIKAPTSVRRLSNLRPGVKYEWQVQTMYSDSRHDTSHFIAGPSFTTFSDCDKPGNMEARVLSSSTVILRWEYMSPGALYMVKIKMKRDSSFTTYNTNTNNLVVGGLEPGKGYEWAMMAYCDGTLGGGHSDFTDTTLFVTAMSEEGSSDIAPQKINSYENNSWQSREDINYVTFRHNGEKEASNNATLINQVGQVTQIPMYYKATNGEIAFDIEEAMPPGIYNIEYISGKNLYNRTILIAGR